MYLGSNEEQKIRQQHAIKSMVAEAEILLLRGEKQEQNFRDVDKTMVNEISMSTNDSQIVHELTASLELHDNCTRNQRST